MYHHKLTAKMDTNEACFMSHHIAYQTATVSLTDTSNSSLMLLLPSPRTHLAVDSCSSHLTHSIEQLLSNASPLLYPGLLLSPSKVLRRLYYADRGIHEIWQRLPQEFWPRAEVRVEYENHFARSPCKRVPKVTSLFQLGTIWSSNV